jgi:hypothetical protein
VPPISQSQQSATEGSEISVFAKNGGDQNVVLQSDAAMALDTVIFHRAISTEKQSGNLKNAKHEEGAPSVFEQVEDEQDVALSFDISYVPLDVVGSQTYQGISSAENMAEMRELHDRHPSSWKTEDVGTWLRATGISMDIVTVFQGTVQRNSRLIFKSRVVTHHPFLFFTFLFLFFFFFGGFLWLFSSGH